MLHFYRKAYAYTVDRETGEVLVAVLFNAQNWSFAIDLKTGMPKVSPDIQPGGDVKLERK